MRPGCQARGYHGGVIVRPEGDRLLLITQPAHARLARTVMERCVPLALHPRRGAILRAVAGHDAGWADADAAPLVTADGSIADFVNAPVAVRQGVWPRSVAALADDPWAAALVAHHAITVYDRFRPDAAWSAFFADMADRRVDLVRESGLSLDTLEEDYAYLRLGDLLSLAFCTGIETPQQFGGWTVQRHGRRVSITPDAFGGVIPMAIDAVDLPARRFVDAADLHREMRVAATRTLTGEAGAFTLDPPADALRARRTRGNP